MLGLKLNHVSKKGPRSAAVYIGNFIQIIVINTIEVTRPKISMFTSISVTMVLVSFSIDQNNHGATKSFLGFFIFFFSQSLEIKM